MNTDIKTVEEYFSLFPEETQMEMHKIREVIKENAPKAEEVISYKMPAYKYHGMLVYFAAYKNHIGFYPGAGGVAAFKEEVSKYKNAKGSVQFPLGKPLPLALVKKIVKFRVKENEEKALKKVITKK
ncbi:MAG: DUF1801 domain-containing protein [Bacteroidetes bacterium]|nr:DUF1801 domain-containing protein [Bacteroidota bacterium]